MDPNAALAALRRLVIVNREPTLDTATVLQRLDRACELFEALDEWISRGGFLPADWQPPAPVVGTRKGDKP